MRPAFVSGAWGRKSLRPRRSLDEVGPPDLELNPKSWNPASVSMRHPMWDNFKMNLLTPFIGLQVIFLQHNEEPSVLGGSTGTG